MRWEELFADLEGQLEAAAAADLDAEVADRTRREAALLVLVDRVRGALGHRVTLRVGGAGLVDGVLRDVGLEWVLVEDGGREALVPLGAVRALTGLTPWSGAPEPSGRVARQLSLRWALRGIARDRSGVTAVLLDATVLTGTVDRVGADFVEIAAHGPGEPRRRADVRAVQTVPLEALAVLRRAG